MTPATIAATFRAYAAWLSHRRPDPDRIAWLRAEAEALDAVAWCRRCQRAQQACECPADEAQHMTEAA
jgi:hypothetical protein